MEKKPLISGTPFSSPMWTNYKLRMDFVGRLCGHTPMNPDVREAWLESRKPSVKPPGGKSVTAILEEVANRTENIAEENEEKRRQTTVGFQKVDGKIIVPAYCIRGHLKDCIDQVSRRYVGKVKGEAAFTTRIKNATYIAGDVVDQFGTAHCSVMRDGSPVIEIDDHQERMCHAITPTGQKISALKHFAFIVRPSITCTIGIIEKSVSLGDLELVLTYGATHGFLGERSMGEGKYNWSVWRD